MGDSPGFDMGRYSIVQTVSWSCQEWNYTTGLSSLNSLASKIVWFSRNGTIPSVHGQQLGWNYRNPGSNEQMSEILQRSLHPMLVGYTSH
jgi:hypothetical protein